MSIKKARNFAIACGLLWSGVACADEWPNRAVTVVVPFAAGGTTDMVARPIAQVLSQRLGQPVVVDNRAGAGGTLAAAAVAKAPADGYTIFLATVAHTMAPGLYKSLPYNFEKDFEPITIAAQVPNILIVNPALPAKSVDELMAYINANPGKVNYGSAGPGSTEHMSGELFRSMAGANIVHVPYKGGAPMMTDLISGQIQMAIETSGSATPQIQAGAVRALAVSTARRSPFFPDLPTLAEAGLKDYDVTTWYGFLVPKGTPKEICDKLYAQISEALKSPEIRARLKDMGAEPGGETPVEFAKFIHAETDKWSKVAKDAGAKIE
ncbi:tripartite tricarboxylate transporter substrate binding protein [Bradyrhizobium prioriisuperbiae]|uniref:Bug family tripartite tricarboxylate transporter substrate binding protein n=1 Tax=Bradyrhizobium prioriisuperbiae TaxID=2854389 RepID=UPI0028EDFFCD|nr:tripartite tricarboxylate transporter substrate binding protein [Bradyrhizobium prioritasuperba]